MIQNTISELMESLLSSEGRFKTLQGVTLEEFLGVNPQIQGAGSLASFRVRYNHRSYLLRAVINAHAPSDVALAQRAAYIGTLPTTYLVGYDYYGEELLVFDGEGNGRYSDISMMEYPDGVLFGEAIVRLAQLEDVRSLEQVLESLRAMAQWLLAQEWVHGNLKPSTLLVNAEGGVKMLHYEYLARPADETYLADRDNLSLALLLLVAKFAACAPAQAALLQGTSLLCWPKSRAERLEVLQCFAQGVESESLGRVCELLTQRRGDATLQHKLSEVLSTFAQSPMRVSPSLLGDLSSGLFAPQGSSTLAPTPPEQIPLQGASTEQSPTHYDWISRQSEALRVVERAGKFGVIDEFDKVVIPLIYDNVDDFSEGRSVVIRGGEFGLLDKEGTLVLPIEYESVDWFAEVGVAAAQFDGKGGLFDRNGAAITPLKYGWIGVPSAGMIQVKSSVDERFGYITVQGEEVIAPRYIETFDFTPQGTARVVSEQGECWINRRGKQVDPPR